jgi:RNA exonuclease 4
MWSIYTINRQRCFADITQVTDARATMALYRLFKIEWEQSIRPATEAYKAKLGKGKGKEKDGGGKRKRDADSDEEEEEAPGEKQDKKRKEEFPGGGRRGVSSGLSVIVRRGGKRVDGPRQRGIPRSSTGQESGTGSGGSWWEQV